MLENANAGAVRYANKVLQNLPGDVLARLRLRPVQLPLRREIEFPGQTIGHLFFLESGVASMTTTFKDGSQVEVGLFGLESILGVSALMGTLRSLNRIYAQLSGHGYMSPIAAARAEFQLGGVFQTAALRNAQAQFNQTAQTAGCNAKHDVQQRLARWLLLCGDRSGSNSLAVSQDFIATMLGVRRMSANVALNNFRELGLIDSLRGNIRILNTKGLEAQSCECYQILKQHLNNAAEFNRGY